MFKKILIANRGEIALRILRACHDLGIQGVLAYSDADRDSLPVQLADEAVCIGPGPAARSYNHIPSILSAALATGCDAIHPGYGFLSENATLAEVCHEVNVTFIGPAADTIRQMGDKATARSVAQAAGVPVLPGSSSLHDGRLNVRELTRRVGFPMMLKAAAGGGGRGMRIAHDDRELMRLLPLAQAEAQAAFSDGSIYAERFLERPRHIEVQILADKHGNVRSLWERDCSAQRRHQKLIEEGPAPRISKNLRESLSRDAVKLAHEIDYVGAGTFEFLVEDGEKHYFIEANTRIQVEHPVTELITGLDLVTWQIRIAGGEEIDFEQKRVPLRGHAVEARINAENPDDEFRPVAGTVDAYLAPGGPGIRVDSHLYPGYTIPTNYDSLLAKVIAWGPTRLEAIVRLERALSETLITGVETTVPFLQRVLRDPEFRAGDVSTQLVAEVIGRHAASPEHGQSGLAPPNAGSGAR